MTERDVLEERIASNRELLLVQAKLIDTLDKRVDKITLDSGRHDEQLNGEDGLRQQLRSLRGDLATLTGKVEDSTRASNRIAFALVAAALAFAVDIARGVLV